VTPPPLKNPVFLHALQRQPVPYTPVWLMRQAGRYLPEYRALRKRAGSFLKLAQTPEYACEATLQPLQRFALDAAILFSDILVVPHAMGLGLGFTPGVGPHFAHPVQSETDVHKLHIPDVSELQYVFDAIALVQHELHGKVPLIGFAGSPWTIACYMVEGQGSRDYHQIKRMLYARPDLLHRILHINAQATADYLNAQIRAGVQAVMLFDSWGGVLADGAFQEFSLAYTRQVIQNLVRQHHGRQVPVIVFTKGGNPWVEDIAACGGDAIGLDWTANLAAVRTRTGDAVALQGNLDPAILLTDAATVRLQVQRVLADFGSVGNGGHIFNLGHGISQFTDPDLVHVLIEAVHKESTRYHG